MLAGMSWAAASVKHAPGHESAVIMLRRQSVSDMSAASQVLVPLFLT